LSDGVVIILEQTISMNNIAQKIIETRKLKGLTQNELADKALVSIKTIQRIENSENEPRGKTLQLICEVLDLDIQELQQLDTTNKKIRIAKKLVDLFFLVALNSVLMGIIGFLTLDINANLNSRFGAILISLFLPGLIVFFTPNLTALERLIKYGSGFVLYFILVMTMHNFALGFTTALFPCLLLAVAVLYYGEGMLSRRMGMGM